jgi:alpha-L-fucosidase 2
MGLKEAFDLARAVILRERFPAGHARTTHWINLQPAAWRCPEDNYLGAVATTEMLLQSQGEVMRLFPAWPRDMAARFRGLPARGGFLVSAQWHPQRGLSADITSVAGEPCRIRWPQDQLPSVTLGGQPTSVRREGRDIVFDTDPGAHYRLQTRAQQA